MKINVGFALMLATLAGLSTGIGSIHRLFYFKPPGICSWHHDLHQP
jgi:hypothetical protein